MSNVHINLSRNLFNDVYFPYLKDYSKRYEVYYGGSGSGKSVFITQKLILKLMSEKRKLLVIRKVGRTLKESVYQLFIDILSKWKLYQFCNVNKTDYSIKFPNGSTIIFKGLDDSEKIKSITGIDDIWVEEATELSLDEFTQLNLRLRSKASNQQIIVSFNPISKNNWVYKKWFINDIDSNTTMILKTTYKDNHFLPLDYISELENLIKTNNTYYRIYALGEFVSLNKLIYTNWEIQDLNPNELINKNYKTIVGLDFGYVNDVTALITAYVDTENKVIYIIDEFTSTGLTNDKIANIIISKGLSKSDIIADSAEIKSIDEIKKLGVSRIKPCSKGKDSVLNGINILQQYSIIVDYKCERTITELENYSWEKDKNTGEYVNQPNKSQHFDHCLDALRYAIQIITNKNKIKTLKTRL